MTSAPRATRSLFGRDDLRDRIEEHVGAVAGGTGRFVWLAGEAGIGKTRLLAELEALAEEHGVRVLRATAWDDPGTPPFWLWVQVVREAAAGRTTQELAEAWGPRARPALDLLPEAGTGSEEPQDTARFALFDAIEAVLGAVAQDGPVAVVLDDLHWTDVGSLRALQHVERSLSRLPLLLAVGWRTRDTADQDLLARAAELAARADHVLLGGIAPPAVAQLVSATTGIDVDPRQAELVAARTHGNPLFVRELARLALDRGNTTTRGAQLLVDGVPGTARAIIGRRLARVSQTCHDVLALAAVAGTAASLELVAELTGQDVDVVSAVLDEAVAAGVVEVSAGRITFTHPLLRDSLMTELPSNRAREIHLAAGRLLAPFVDTEPATAAEVAHHLRAALPLGDRETAVAMLRRAAQVASGALAFEEAAAHLAQALAVLPGDAGHDRFELLLAWGEALAAAGDADGARGAYTSAADLARAGGDAEGLARAALGFGAGLSGFEVQLWDQTQIDLLDEALERLPATDSETRADVMARLSVALAFTDGAHRRDRLAADAVAMARRIGSPRVVAHALAAHCDAIAGPDHSEEREQEAGEVVELARAAGDRGIELLGLRLRVVARLEQGLSREAHDDMVTFARLAERVGQPLYSWFVPLWHGFEAHAAGDLDELERCTQEVERVGALAESTNAHVLGIVQHSWIAIERDRAELFLDEMRNLMDELASLAPDGGVMVGMYPGQPDAARRAVIPRLHEALAHLPKDAEHVSNLSLAATSLWLSQEDAGAAAAVHEHLLPYRHRFGVDGIGAGAIGSVERLLGATATLAGRLDDAAEHFEAGLRCNAAAGLRLPLAHTRATYAECLRRRDAPGDADCGESCWRRPARSTSRWASPSRWRSSTARWSRPDRPPAARSTVRGAVREGGAAEERRPVGGGVPRTRRDAQAPQGPDGPRGAARPSGSRGARPRPGHRGGHGSRHRSTRAPLGRPRRGARPAGARGVPPPPPGARRGPRRRRGGPGRRPGRRGVGRARVPGGRADLGVRPGRASPPRRRPRREGSDRRHLADPGGDQGAPSRCTREPPGTSAPPCGPGRLRVRPGGADRVGGLPHIVRKSLTPSGCPTH